MKSVYLSIAFSFLAISAVFAQETTTVKCGATEVEQELFKQFPELEQKAALYDYLLKESLAQVTDGNQSSKTTDFLDTTTQYKIALVFHILHTYNQEDNNDWVTDETIKACVASINHDWNGSYLDTSDVVPYFKDKVGNGRVTFVLANKDPQGNCTNGIDRIYSGKAILGGTPAKLNQWPQDKYINVWVAKVAGVPGAAAYAIFPSSADAVPFLDGIMASNDYVTGRPSGNASTISHELGHIFSLAHLWGRTNAPGVACGDDDVWDTPPTKGHSPQSGNCNNPALLGERETQCWDTTTTPAYAYFLLDSNCVSNVQNIMEYTYCDRMFSKDQMKRARGVMQNLSGSSTNASRENLITPATHAFTGIDVAPTECDPLPDFFSQRRFVLQGSTTVPFRNYSSRGNLTSATYSWSAPNSSTPTSSANVVFNTTYPSAAGWQDITLDVSANGKTGSLTKSKYIFVQHPNVGDMQTFEDAAKNEWWPTFNYYDNMFAWNIVDKGAFEGTHAIKYNAFDNRVYPASLINTASYDVDDFFTEPYDLTNKVDPYLNFWLSGASTSSDANSIGEDKLVIEFSTNGGLTWAVAGSGGTIKGGNLYNAGVYLSEYTPGGSWDYLPVTVNLPPTAISNQTIFKFSMRPAGDAGNAVYIDNINVSDWPTGINETESNLFSVNPNPVINGPLVISSTKDLINAQITITDVTGRTIQKSVVNNSQNIYQISRDVFPSAGIYMVTMIKNGERFTQRVSVL